MRKRKTSPLPQELVDLIQWHEAFSRRPDKGEVDEKIRRWLREPRS